MADRPLGPDLRTPERDATQVADFNARLQAAGLPPVRLTDQERADLIRQARHALYAHTPDNQGADRWPDRCSLCHYTRHPCEVYDLAAGIIALTAGDPE